MRDAVQLKGGHVLNPANHQDGIADVAITDGRILRTADAIDPAEARHIIDVSGLLVTPGLLDIHMHAYATRRKHESGPWRGSLVADTHVFARQFPVIDAEGRVYPSMREARARGVWFDLGHGAASFWFRNARRAIDDGFPPDSISTDLHDGSIRTTVHSMLDAMSKHPYIIMERLHGESYGAHRNHMSPEEECALAAQVAEMVRALHETPTERLRSFGRSPGEWVRRIRARAPLWEEDLAPQSPPHLAAQVPAFLAETLPLVTEAFRPCLLSADLHAWHILVEKRGGAWRVTGHIDLGDVEVGPVEYEWVPLCQKAFRGSETLMRAFFAAYGWSLPVPREVKQRLKLYTLLHRFPPLDFPDRQITEGSSLEAILEGLWPI